MEFMYFPDIYYCVILHASLCLSWFIAAFLPHRWYHAMYSWNVSPYKRFVL